MNYNSIKTELSGDLISRDAVLKEINCWIGSGEYRYAMSEHFLINRIKTLPPVNPQEPKWIPVSERLPEKEGRYLTTILNEYDNRLRYIMTCDYFPNGYWYPDEESASSNVIAWMPLPEPYNEKRDLKESEDKE